MMAEVKVLIDGYAREENGTELATSTTTLIKDNKLNIIVDPGMNRDLLLNKLDEEDLSVNDINFVVLTHYHLDHSLLTGIFDNAKVLDNTDIYSFDGMIKSHGGKIPETEIEIIKTPGHDAFHCSVIVNDEKLGEVVIAGDVFWWKDKEEIKIDKESLINHEDSYVKDEGKLNESREKILEIADYIIPEHGRMFKVER